MQTAIDLSNILLPSPLSQASDESWTAFVRVMMTAKTNEVSDSNALGAFQITPRRLVDLGVLDDDLKRVRSKKVLKRVIWAASSDLNHVRAARFLKSANLQYKVFVQSMIDYSSKISSGAVKLPPGCTLSGALSILHKAGLSGLSGTRFPATQEIFERANGVF